MSSICERDREPVSQKIGFLWFETSKLKVEPWSMADLKNEQECFIGLKTTKRSRVVLDPIEHVLRVF